MPRTSPSVYAGFIAILAIFLLVVPARAFTESYCSSQNTAPDNTYYQWQYQSNGNCTNHCNTEVKATYAFSVIKWDECWCSNYIPQQQTDVGRCGKDCPGFPAEHCGSKDDNLFIYIKLNGQPSGTAGGSQPTSAIVSSAVPPPSSSPAPAPSSSTRVQTSNKPSTFQTVSSNTPQTSHQVVTESGIVITRTVIQTPSTGPSSSSAPVRTNDGDGGTNVGAIAGGAAGGVLALVAIVGGILFVLWRRRQKQHQMHDELNAAGIGGGSSGITRNTSTMSQAGLLGRGAGISQYPPTIGTNLGSVNSRYGDQESISPSSNRRNSQPLVIDSRLNPNAVLTFAHANASRESMASMDDSRDYGRQLNVRNPDP